MYIEGKMLTKIKRYFKEHWNKLDIISFVLSIISFLYRIFSTDKSFVGCRILYGLTFVCFSIKFFQFFLIHKYIGPLLIAILKMLKEVYFFSYLIIYLILLYGITSHSIRYSNANFGKKLFFDIFNEPFLNIFGEFNTDKFEEEFEKNCSKKLNGTKCTESPKFAYFLFYIYAFLSHILILSLLTAKLTGTIDKVLQESNIYHGYLRYSLIRKYNLKPLFFPPISFLLIFLSFFETIRNWTFIKDQFLIKIKKKGYLNYIERKGRDQIFLNDNLKNEPVK